MRCSSDILEENPVEPLAVFVVWFAVLGPDDASQVDTSLLDDERAAHYWDSDGEVGAFFSHMVIRWGCRRASCCGTRIFCSTPTEVGGRLRRRWPTGVRP